LQFCDPSKLVLGRFLQNSENWGIIHNNQGLTPEEVFEKQYYGGGHNLAHHIHQHTMTHQQRKKERDRNKIRKLKSVCTEIQAALAIES
jgi:hypothetical protein